MTQTSTDAAAALTINQLAERLAIATRRTDGRYARSFAAKAYAEIEVIRAELARRGMTAAEATALWTGE